MIKHKELFIKELQKATNRQKRECITINNILESYFLIGRNNKKKIINDFIKELNITKEAANKLYNECIRIIIKITI